VGCVAAWRVTSVSDWVAASGTDLSRRRIQRFALLLLVACWIQYTSAWIWPPARVVAQGTVAAYEAKPYAIVLQYVLWPSILIGLALSLRRRGMAVVRHLSVFMPYLVLMTVSSVFGIWFFQSLRLTILWCLSVLAGAAVAALADRATLTRALIGTIAVTMLASLAMFWVLPDLGSDRYFGRQVLRGVFDNKNQAGRIAALALVVVFALRHDARGWLRNAALFSAGACLVLADSKTALASAALAIAYLWLLERVRGGVHSSLGLLAVGVVLLLAALLLQVLAPLAVELVGRDLTLTGRTLIWQVYLREISQVWWVGAGPGAFTNVSPLTVPLALELRAMGSIFSPHSYLLGTLGDLGVPGLVYTLLLFGFLTVWLPLRSQGRFALACAAVGAVTLLQGIGETNDAAAAGISWFLLGLFWVAHVLEQSPREQPLAAEGFIEPESQQRPRTAQVHPFPSR
jgi:O-antigen ligase